MSAFQVAYLEFLSERYLLFARTLGAQHPTAQAAFLKLADVQGAL